MHDTALRATAPRLRLARRALLLGAVPSVLAAQPPAPSIRFPEDCRILFAGQPGGPMARWADRIAQLLRPPRAAAPPLRQTPAGGDDGVTAANQFSARVAPDGATALLTPGSVVLARLCGDPRAQFDPGQWISVTAGLSSALCVARADLATLRAGQAVKVAASGPVGADLPALLGVELLGLKADPVFGLVHREAALRAFASGAVDAVLVHGPDVAPYLTALAAAGGTPRFSFGMPGTGGWQRDSLLPDLPALPELLAGRAAPEALATAWRAAATAVQLEYLLVLPNLSPAPLVAQWRQACAADVDSEVPDVHPLDGLQAAPATKLLAADPAAILATRQWLAARFKWQPA